MTLPTPPSDLGLGPASIVALIMVVTRDLFMALQFTIPIFLSYMLAVKQFRVLAPKKSSQTRRELRFCLLSFEVHELLSAELAH